VSKVFDRIDLGSVPPARVRWAGIALVIAIVGGSGAFVLSSWIDRRDEMDRIQTRLERVSAQHERLSNARAAIIGRIESAGAEIADAPVPERPSTMNALAARMTMIADEIGLKTQRIDPGRGGAVGDAQPINASFIGSYAMIERWLDRVHAEIHDLHITRIELAPDRAETRSLRVTMRSMWYKPGDPTPIDD